MGFLSKLFGGGANNVDAGKLIKDGALLIDARSPQEFSGGHIEGAVNIPHNVIARIIHTKTSDKKRAIVVYCQSGGRSAMAVTALKRAGYALAENGGTIDALRRQLGNPSHG
ncbi:rhodanese-like domain-containing protein [Pontiellaceae bacterium B12219]|nr:rhodanese-like domain-containing protein [Pontiellaceae bacterium B12219]